MALLQHLAQLQKDADHLLDVRPRFERMLAVRGELCDDPAHLLTDEHPLGAHECDSVEKGGEDVIVDYLAESNEWLTQTCGGSARGRATV